jgi:long-chain fatty acid transport protein
MREETRAGAVLVSLSVAAAFAVGGVYGSGYSVYEQGAEAMANAGAFTARADDPSAIFFNPAGLARLDGSRLNVGTNAIFLTGSEFESAGTGQRFNQADNIAWPSSLYYTHKVNDRWAYGLGFTSPFGLKTQWDSSFEGRFISRESNLAVAAFNANGSFKVGKSWSVAVGIDWAKADIRELSRDLDLAALCGPGCEGFSKLTGDGTDIGWNVAAQWVGESGWRWGGSYRAEMKPDIDGEVDFSVPVAVSAFFPDGGAKAIIPLPASFATGVGYVGKKWEGEIDVVWTGWSVFEHLDIDIETNTLAVGDISQTEDWHDTYSYRVGYSYHINDRHEYRLGAYLDRNPVPNTHVRPRLPDADRTSAQVGYGYAGKGGFTFDVAYQALFFDDRTATGSPTSASDPVQPGEYTNFTSLLGVSVGWKWGK